MILMRLYGRVRLEEKEQKGQLRAPGTELTRELRCSYPIIVPAHKKKTYVHSDGSKSLWSWNGAEVEMRERSEAKGSVGQEANRLSPLLLVFASPERS